MAVFFTVADYLHAKSKQPIEVPGIMKGSDGYFDPQIRVYSTVDSGNIILRPKDCKYIFPTNTEGYTAFCSRDCFRNSDTCEDSRSDKDGYYSIPCMCATQTTVCGSAGISHVIDLGCIKIPGPPAPPVFLDQFAISLMPRIVPVSNIEGNSYSHPKIKVIVESGTGKVERVLEGTKNSEKIETVFYPDTNGIKFNFKVTTDESKICAAYLGYGDDVNSNTPPKLEDCFVYPGPKKPTGLDYNGGTNSITVSNNPDGIAIKTVLPKTVLTATDQNACQNIHCEIGDFLGGFICRKGDGNIKPICNGGSLNSDMNCQNGEQLCPEGYLVGMGYTEDVAGSNLICVDSWEPKPPMYVMTEDPENKVFTETRYAFVAYDKNGVRLDDPAVHIEEMEQAELDSISPQGLGMYLLNDKYYKYEKIKYFCHSNNLNGNFCSIDPTITAPDSIDAQGKAHYKETNLVTLGGLPYFLPEDSGVNKYSENRCGNTFCYMQPNLYINDLCTFKDQPPCKASIYHIDSQGNTFDSRVTPILGSCDFLKIEAIGGGAAGSIKSNKAHSGSSGGYVSVNVPRAELTNYNLVVTVLGLGGSSDDEAGKDTLVYLCKSNYKILNQRNTETIIKYHDRIEKALFRNNEEEFIQKNCKLLVTAKGGAADKQIAHNDDPIGSDFKGKLTYIKNFLSVKGKDEENGHNPIVPKPNIKGSLDELDHYFQYDQNVCAIPLPMEFDQLNLNDQQHDPCLQGFNISENKKFYGSGGCASKTDKQFFAGTAGAAKVTCEKWRN